MHTSGAPLIGRLMHTVKAPLHQLVIYYVNRALARTNTTQMIQARLIDSLQAEVANLEGRLAAAEEALRQLREAQEGR